MEPLTDEIRYQLLRFIEENPNVSQRELAHQMGLSVGKINYCVKALIDVGYIKLSNFKKSRNKSGYAYFLTPKGAKEKVAVTIRFLEFKRRQYDLIKKEILNLQKEIQMQEKEKDLKNNDGF